ncbi:MAG: D-aminoacyl-tRNA deacylase [Nanoarchaeota archaeon]
MKTGIIISKRIERDFGLLVNEMLRKKGIEVIEIEDFPLYLSDEDLEKYNCDYYMAIAIHSLRDYPKRFCVHVCGNWNKKWPRLNFDLGGKEKTLCGNSPSLLKFVYQSLIKHNHTKDFVVSIEATHHGPHITKPILMLEIGSNKKAWENEEANSIVCQVVEDTLSNFVPEKRPASLILGGEHYMKELRPLLHKKDFLIGPMCPSSQIEHFNDKLLQEALNKTEGGIKNALINIPGVGQHYERITSLLKDRNIEFVGLHDVLEIGG